ncbi:MAG: C2 family cysteine protease, partial [Roseiarcus sp.]
MTSPGLGVGGGAPAPAGAGVARAAGSAGAGGSATPSWISSLSTPSIETDMAAADVNGVVTAQGLTKLLTDLDATLSSSSPLTSAEFNDLQTIAANLNTGLSTSSYLTYAFKALADGNAANATWTGGIKYTASPYGAVLGNLAAGATKTQLSELTGKWFLGTDLPNSYVNMPGDPNVTFTVTYSTVANAVFGASGPSINDINQGVLGDCYFEASCAEVADENPSYIESMFSNNGNGTYGVRFYYDGAAEYVTVNLSLADGGTEFNQATDIWASLAEKAWAEFQAINLDTGNSGPSYNYGDSWSTIGNGGYIANALEALTGASVITGFDPNGTSWIDETWNSSLNWTGSTSGLTTSSVLASVEAALANHDDVDISTNPTLYGYDTSGNETLIPDHVFSVYGYDSGTGMLEVRNPWGDFNGQHYDGSTKKYYDPTFEVSLTTLLADSDWVEFDNVGGASALPNPAAMANYLNNISAYDEFVSGIQISDLAAAVAAGFDALNADSDIKSITLADSGVPALSLTTTQAADDTTALGKLTNQDYEIIAGGAHTYYDHATVLIAVTDSNASFKLSGGAQAKVTGGANTINLSGSGDAVTILATSGNWDVVNGSNGTVNLSSAQAAVTGGGDAIDFSGGSGNAVGLYSTGGSWDTVSGSNGTVYLTSAQAAVTGGGDWIHFAGGSGN